MKTITVCGLQLERVMGSLLLKASKFNIDTKVNFFIKKYSSPGNVGLRDSNLKKKLDMQIL